ncbi:hypothetical protein [Xanthomonas citri]|uniref:hypothetical protein n=1 Tax=Xanthomonas citri TaxID=346 RepID=UPI002155F9E5|nr:hypothetical protein [Xanthomonas citri]
MTIVHNLMCAIIKISGIPDRASKSHRRVVSALERHALGRGMLNLRTRLFSDRAQQTLDLLQLALVSRRKPAM